MCEIKLKLSHFYWISELFKMRNSVNCLNYERDDSTLICFRLEGKIFKRKLKALKLKNILHQDHLLIQMLLSKKYIEVCV